jgi:hypothetical protein
MIHVDDGTLQAWLDGELSGAARAGVEEHVASCDACAEAADALRALSARAHTALAVLGDAPVATLPALAEVRRRARSRGFSRIPAGLIRAAALLLIFGGVVAAAIPGSPLRRWIADVVGDEPAVEPAPAMPQAPVVEPPPRIAPVQETGLSILPAEGRLTIRLQDVGPDTEVVVREVDEELAWARWNAANTDVRQRSGAGRLEISNVGPGTMTLLIPRSAQTVIVEVDGSIWWTRENGRVRVLGPGPQRDGDGVVFHQR